MSYVILLLYPLYFFDQVNKLNNPHVGVLGRSSRDGSYPPSTSSTNFQKIIIKSLLKIANNAR